MENKRIVLDAKIIIRSVLGTKIQKILQDNYNFVDFYTPEQCLEEARKYIPIILKKKKPSH